MNGSRPTRRVWLVNHYAVPPTLSGITRHHGLASELIRLGHDVRVVASSFHHATRSEHIQYGDRKWLERDESGVPFLWVKTPAYGGNNGFRIVNMLAFASRVKAMACGSGVDRPDVVVGSSPHLFAALASEQAARALGARFICEVRDLWPESLVQLAGKSRAHPMVVGLGWIEGRVYRRASQVWTLLGRSHDYITQRGGPAGKVFHLPNGVDLRALPPVSLRGASDGSFVVLYAGSLAFQYGLEVLIEAAAIWERSSWGSAVLLRFLGDGPERGRLEALASRFGVKRVEFLNPVPKAQVFSRLSEADALVAVFRDLPLYRYGTSVNKVNDYLAAGRPVIFAVDSPDDPVARSGGGIAVKPGDPSAIAAAVKRLIEMGGVEREQMGQRGRAHVEQRGSLESVALEAHGLLMRA